MKCIILSLGNYTTVTSELGSGKPLDPSSLQLEEVAVIIGSVLGFLLIVLFLTSYCYCYTRKRRKQQEQKDTEKKRGSGSIIVKSGSCQGGLDEMEGSRGSSMENGIKDIESDGLPPQQPGNRPLSPVQSWGATTLLQEHERRLSVHSSGGQGADDYLVVYQPEPTPFPDVTVTDYRTCAGTAPTPTPSTNTHSTDPPAYYQSEDGTPCPCTPGPEYSNYNPGWDEPLTGHLLSRVRQGGVPPPQIPQQAVNHLDRKRRNVTQV